MAVRYLLGDTHDDADCARNVRCAAANWSRHIIARYIHQGSDVKKLIPPIS